MAKNLELARRMDAFEKRISDLQKEFKKFREEAEPEKKKSRLFKNKSESEW